MFILGIEIFWVYGVFLEFLYRGFTLMDDKFLVFEDV